MTVSHIPDPLDRPADLFSVAANPRRRVPAPRSTGSDPQRVPPTPRSARTAGFTSFVENSTVASVAPHAVTVVLGDDGAAPHSSTVAVSPVSVALPGTVHRPSGLPAVLDPFAVATRAVLVLIGALEPARHIARAAIGSAIDNEASAAIDVVVPRAVDLVLRRASHLVTIGAGPSVVDHYSERLALWRRLALRSGLEPAAIALTLAPFSPHAVAAMLRVDVEAVTECLDRWYGGFDPPTPAELARATSTAPPVAEAFGPHDLSVGERAAEPDPGRVPRAVRAARAYTGQGVR